MQQQKVVIIGHSFTSRLGLIRSVARIGCEITVVAMTGYKRGRKKLNTDKPVDCYSKYVSNVYYCLREDKEAFIHLLLERCTDPDRKVVLIPDSDDTVAAIDANKEKLEKYFYFPYILGETDSIAYWMDKSHQKEAARSVGLDVADARIISIVNGQYTLPDDLNYPCFPKPVATMNGGKGGMKRCDDAAALSQVLDFIVRNRSRTVKLLIEDYKPIDQEYALLGFSDGKEVVIPGILKLLAVSKKNKGIARQGLVMPVGELSDLVEKFKRLILKIGFVGVFDIDFFESQGIYFFCEVNLRFGGSGYAVTKMGVNLPAMMVKSMTGESLEGLKKNVTGEAVYANERMCIDDWYNGYLSRKEYWRILQNADIRFVPDTEDPLPEEAYERYFQMRRRRKIIKNMLNILWEKK